MASPSFISRARALLSRDQNLGSYGHIAANDEEAAQIKLTGAIDYDPELDDDSEADGLVRRRFATDKRTRLCGRCNTFWKLVPIVLVILGLGGSYALFTRLSRNPSSSGLDVPVFGESLGCFPTGAPYIYGDATQVYTIPIGPIKRDFYLNVRGGAVGTITLAPLYSSSDTAEDDDGTVSVEMTLRSDDKELLSMTIVEQTDPEANPNSLFRLSTAHAAAWSANSCMRYDIVLRVPPSLRKLHIAAHTLSHIRLGEDASGNATNVDGANNAINFDDFFVTMYHPRNVNLLVSSTSVSSTRMALEMIGGWMVGSAALLKETKLTTQRGRANMLMDVIAMPYMPSPASNSSYDPTPEEEDPKHEHAKLQTVTGSGRTDITFLSSFVSSPANSHSSIPAHSTRNWPIHLESDHISSANGPIYLHYEKSGFTGRVQVGVPSGNILAHEGVLGYAQGSTDNSNDDGDESKWPWVADINGKDKMKIKSRQGMVGVWF